MIFLLSNTVTGEIMYLSDKKEYKVGRKNCDILLENDQSISREHAKLRGKGDHVTLEDCKSKYLTFYKGSPVEPNVEIPLKHLDVVQFGIYNNKFCFESYEFMVAASALSSDMKLTLKQSLAKCRGKYVDKWSSKCTHLTVDKLTLTIKVLQALVDEKPIVTVEYWVEYAKSCETKASFPDIDKYRPPIGEQLLRSDFEYKIDPRRKKLFHNKLFVFLKGSTKNQMQDVIESCGGSSISWEEEPKTLFDINKSPLEHLMIKTDNDEQNISFDAIIKELNKQNKRAIPLNEIALAIVHCDCDVNCNPNFNKVSEVFGGAQKQKQARDVLARETQSEKVLPVVAEIKSEKIIPQSVEDDWMAVSERKENIHRSRGETSGIKRSSDQQIEVTPSKKSKSEGESNRRIENGAAPTPFLGRQTTRNNKVESDSSKNKTHPSQKRKASDEPDGASCSKSNPFSSIQLSLNKKSKSSDEANPFQLIRTPKPSTSKANQNPFDSIMNVSNRTSSAVKVEKILPQNEPRRQVKLIPIETTNSNLSIAKISFLNITWTSKSTVKHETIIEEDPELAKISEAFKDCVKVEVLSVYERTNSFARDTSTNGMDGIKNFKTFKKVKPLKPQVTIISRHAFKKIAPGDLTGIAVNEQDSEDEDGPAEIRIKETSKRMGKRFVL